MCIDLSKYDIIVVSLSGRKDSQVVLLITTDRQPIGTQTVTRYSAVFAREKYHLDPVEMNVFDMVQKHPDSWTCGCVTGLPEKCFADTERKAFQCHGIDKRFSL